MKNKGEGVVFYASEINGILIGKRIKVENIDPKVMISLID